MIAALVALALAASPPAGDAALKKELQATYDAYAQACVRQDLDAVMAMLTPDVQWTMADGSKLDRAGVEASMRDFLKTLGPGSSARFAIRSLARKGDGVLVDVHLTVTLLQPDPDHPGKKVKHVGRSGWHDLWVKGSGGWLNRTGEEYEVPPPKT
ncbi:MAG TPA: nuclear transport factor 2 family protein [Myxococcaceae bacterium]|nr:nuclear transport factor 2 family protein [Myxococcaceae bacterium]